MTIPLLETGELRRRCFLIVNPVGMGGLISTAPSPCIAPRSSRCDALWWGVVNDAWTVLSHSRGDRTSTWSRREEDLDAVANAPSGATPERR